MGDIRKRRLEADYLNVGTPAAPSYALCGTGFTALTESPSAQTSSKRYVNQASATQRVTSYEWSSAFEADQIKSEAALAHILNIAKKLLTGSSAEAYLVQVDLDDPSPADSTTIFRARRRTVAIAVSEMPDNDGEMGVNGDFLGVSDPEEGTFNISTKVFTADGASAEQLVTFEVTGTAGARLAGAQIVINGQLLTTDANGLAEIYLAADDYDYTAVCAGYVTEASSVTISSAAVFEEVAMVAAT